MTEVDHLDGLAVMSDVGDAFFHRKPENQVSGLGRQGQDSRR
jgi:hypothetical protein